MIERFAEMLEEMALWMRRRIRRENPETRAVVYLTAVDDEDWTASNIADALQARGYNPMRIMVDQL